VPKNCARNFVGAAVLCTVALVAVVALLLAPTGAGAATPVLEFVVPGHGLPIRFTTESGEVNAEMSSFNSVLHCTASHGEGEITGPRSAVSEYKFTGCVTEKGSHQSCKSENAQEGEITTKQIAAELVFINQEEHEVGVLMDPSGALYIAFECGGVHAEGFGPFLAPVGPINKEAASFTATLSQSGSVQTPDAYETLTGEVLLAIPLGRHGPDTNPLVNTGVEAVFTVSPSSPGEIKAVTTAEELAAERAKQAAETARKHEEEVAAEAAAAKKQQEEQEASVAKQHQEERAAEKREAERLKSRRARLLAKALRVCKKQPKKRRARCIAKAHRKYGSKPK
jgi:hypothetical protein